MQFSTDMDKEYKELIRICRHYLNGDKFTFDTSVDYKKLFSYAKGHNLLGILHCALLNAQNKNDLPENFLKSLENKFFDLIYLSNTQLNMLEEVKVLLKSSQRPFITFKGAVLRESYPVAESRAMGDIDILIKADDRDKVKKLLISAGFDCIKENGPVYNYTKNGALLEVHTKLISCYDTEPFCNAFDYAKFDGFEGKFDNTFHFAYLIAHTAHHFKFYGAGIKLILDFAVMLKSYDIDIQKVFEYLKAVDLEKFGKTVLTVCHNFFGEGTDYGNDTKDVEEYLCLCGAFGNENENKGVTVARRELEEGKKYSPFMTRLRLLFPPYRKLREIDYIKFIDGRPWLILYAWVYRIIYNLKNRKEFTLKAVNSLDDENTQALAQKELELFKEIGLK